MSVIPSGKLQITSSADKDTFDLNYSANKKISAVIEDIAPTKDNIVVTFKQSTYEGETHEKTDDSSCFTAVEKSCLNNLRRTQCKYFE